MSRYKLKENHPAMEAVNELWNKAEELGITIHVGCGFGGSTVITVNGEDFELYDIEDSGFTMTEFPPVCEFKLVFEKEED